MATYRTLGACADELERALAAKAPQGVPTRQQFESELYASDEPLTHKAVMRIFDSAVTAAVPAPVSDDTIHQGMVPPAVTNIRETVQKLHDKASSDAGTWHSTIAYSREERAHWMVFYEGRKAAFGELLGMLGEAAAPKPAPDFLPVTDAERKAYEKETEAATPAPGAERSALREWIEKQKVTAERQRALSLNDAHFWKYWDGRVDAFIDTLSEMREALAAAPPAPPYVQDFNAQSGRGIFVVTGEHQRTAFFDRATAEKYLANQNPERFKIVEYPKPAAAPGSHPTHPTPGYDAAFYEWFKRSPYYDGHWTQESMDYAEGAYLAAGHASAERVRQLEAALQQIANSTCSCLSNEDPNWHGERCLKAIALRALPPSTGEKG